MRDVIPQIPHGVKHKDVLKASVTLDLSPNCFMSIQTEGPWSNTLDMNMTDMFYRIGFDLRRSFPLYNSVFCRLSQQLDQPWETQLQPRIHEVATLFGGHIKSQSSFQTQRKCANMTDVFSLCSVIETLLVTSLNDEQTIGQTCSKHLLDHCLTIWEAPLGFGRADSVRATFLEGPEGYIRVHPLLLDSQIDNALCAHPVSNGVIAQYQQQDQQQNSARMKDQASPHLQFQVFQIVLSCEPGYTVPWLGWMLTQPTVSLTINQATFIARRDAIL